MTNLVGVPRGGKGGGELFAVGGSGGGFGHGGILKKKVLSFEFYVLRSSGVRSLNLAFYGGVEQLQKITMPLFLSKRSQGVQF
jgi:hypothetical protein